MAPVTADPTKAELVVRRPGRSTPMVVCGFCSTGDHKLHRPATRNGNGSLHRCSCVPCKDMVRCLDCGIREPQHVNAELSVCKDPDACQARQHVRTEANPVIRMIREIQEGNNMPNAAAKKAAAARGNTSKATPSGRKLATVKEAGIKPPCACTCGETTGGGRFRPGHDARHVSNQVNLALSRPQSEAKIRRELAAISDALAAKFDKSLAIAKANKEGKPAKATKSSSTAVKKAASKPESKPGTSSKTAKAAAAPEPVPAEDEDEDFEDDEDEDYEDEDEEDEEDAEG